MQYLGGKARQARFLAEIICKIPARRYANRITDAAQSRKDPA